MSEEMITLVTGPTAALVLAVGALIWLARTVLPILKTYLTEQNKSLSELVKALERTVDEHAKDRHTFESAIKTLSTRIEAVEVDISLIKQKL